MYSFAVKVWKFNWPQKLTRIKYPPDCERIYNILLYSNFLPFLIILHRSFSLPFHKRIWTQNRLSYSNAPTIFLFLSIHILLFVNVFVPLYYRIETFTALLTYTPNSIRLVQFLGGEENTQWYVCLVLGVESNSFLNRQM